MESPGVEVRPVELMNGEAHFAEVVLDDVVVPDDKVLGHVGDGWKQVTGELAYERSGPERILSTAPVLLSLLETIRGMASEDPHRLGSALARLSSLRRLSATVASELDSGRAPETTAALAKDLGTQFEQEVMETVRLSAGSHVSDTADNELSRLVMEGITQSPGFTIRGGTTEILRTVVAKGLKQHA
jgi:alkylation response protein AidB-like acyl-CoA dehydrogenase